MTQKRQFASICPLLDVLFDVLNSRKASLILIGQLIN